MDVIDVGVSGTTIRVVDLADNAVQVDTVGWDTPAPALDLSRVPQALQRTVSGRVTELDLPDVNVLVREIDDDGTIVPLGDFRYGDDPMDVPAGRHYCNVQSNPLVIVRFDRAARLDRRGDRRVRLSFDRPTPVTLGFRSYVNYPEHTVTVPPTAAGVATAVTHLSAALGGTGVPAESPGNRVHPPLIEFGDAVEIPEAVAGARHETGIELVVPDRIAPVLPAAPLAYYLGATLRTAERDRPVLRAPAVGVEHAFEPLPGFQDMAARLLRHTLYLDILVRTRFRDSRLAEWDDLDWLDLDVERLNAATSAERLRAYLDLPADRVEAALPNWNLRYYVEPAIEHARLLPFALDDVAQVFLHDPDGEAGAPEPPRPGPAAAFTPQIGWLGADPPPQAFRARLPAYEHELEFTGRGVTNARVLAVDPDRSVDAEVTAGRFEAVGPAEFPVELERAPDRAAVREAVSTPADFLHAVGDHAGGLPTADGRIALEDLPDVAVRLAFLDGPDSTAVGEGLVERGSVAAVVRDPARGDGLSAAARRTFVELLAGGFPLNYARQLVERYAEGPSDLAVVGDGLARIGGSTSGMYGFLHEVEPDGEGSFAVTDFAFMEQAGFYWLPDVPEAPSSLMGRTSRSTTDAAGLGEMLSKTDDPLLYEGRIRWPGPDDLFYPLA